MRARFTIRLPVDVIVSADESGVVDSTRVKLEGASLYRYVESTYGQSELAERVKFCTGPREGLVRVLFGHYDEGVEFLSVVKVTKLHYVLDRNGKQIKFGRRDGREVGQFGAFSSNRRRIHNDDHARLQKEHGA